MCRRRPADRFVDVVGATDRATEGAINVMNKRNWVAVRATLGRVGARFFQLLIIVDWPQKLSLAN